MNWLKSPVTGIDVPIQSLQVELHDSLLATWNLHPDEYQCYGRCQKVPDDKEAGYIPTVYRGDGNYHEVAPNDKYVAQSFFGLGDNMKSDGYYNVQDVHIVFFVHLGRTSTLPNRSDLEARQEVQRILSQNLFGFTLTGIQTGVQNVFQEYIIGRLTANQTSVQQKKGLKLVDMQPFHVFRVNGTIRHSAPQFHETY